VSNSFPSRSYHVLAAATLCLVIGPRRAHAQPVTRAEAARRALAAGPRVALARADTAAARAALITARAVPNPSLAATFSMAPPQRHLILDVPIDAPWSRGPRVGAAQATARAARLRFVSERTAALLEVDTTYTMALAAHARFRLSRQTARDADSLRTMTAARRDAGDASDLDVDLATITAGQQWNVAATDSLTYMSTALTVQTLMGIPADSATIVLVDSLRLTPGETDRMLRELDSTSAIIIAPPAVVTAPVTLPSATPTTAPNRALPAPAPPAPAAGVTTGATTSMSPAPGAIAAAPSVAAAEATLQAAELAVTRERRSVFGMPSVQIGVEWDDQGFDPPSKKLPLFGVSIPLPLFDRNRGPIALAQAERDRARADLAATRLLAKQRLIEGLRERESLRARIARDQNLVASAERVAAKSLTAYREGASALPAVLEARRTAREVLGQYIDDLAALMTLESELRALTQPLPPQ
jgi:cobalt-zinc-cadmium efflux system outer membrane protein